MDYLKGKKELKTKDESKKFNLDEFYGSLTIPLSQLQYERVKNKFFDSEFVKTDWANDLEEYGMTPIRVCPFSIFKYKKPFYTFIDKEKKILPLEMDYLSWFIGPIAVGLKDGNIYIFNQAKNTVIIRDKVKCTEVNISYSMSMNYEYIRISFSPEQIRDYDGIDRHFYFDLDGNEMDLATLNKKIDENPHRDDGFIPETPELAEAWRKLAESGIIIVDYDNPQQDKRSKKKNSRVSEPEKQ